MSRLAWIRTTLWPRAVSAFDARHAAGRAPEGAVEQALAAGTPDEAWALVQGYDPTPGHEALTWLLRRWIDGGIRGEDLAKARDTIFVWSKTKQRLPVGARDLGQYKALAEIDRVLMDAGIDFDTVLDGGAASGKAVKRELADRIREVESIVLLDPSMSGSDGWTIAVPLTMDAARWWGRGTRWCTAAREYEDNAFETYDKDGPLIVFVAPDGEKWQWHPVSGQLANAADNMLTFDQCPAFEKWPELLTYAVSQDGEVLETVPKHFLTEALCLAAVMQDGNTLSHVPIHLRTEALCLAAVRQYGLALYNVPKPLRTEVMCLTAAKQNGFALEHVPEPLRTETICLAAVEQDGWALNYVPDALRTEALCLAAVRQNGQALPHVPNALRTEAVCLMAVKQDGWALYYVPDALRTEAVCLVAVRQNGLALCFLPDALRTETMCLAAVRENGQALCYVPYALRTEALCLAAVKQNGRALEDVPDALRTESLCLTAVTQNGQALYHVPAALLTEAMCLMAVEQDGWALEHVPDALRTETLCLVAVKQTGKALRYVPEHLRNNSAIVAAYDVHLARKREERLTGPLAGIRIVFDTHVADATVAASETCLQDFGNRLRRTTLLPIPEAVTP